MTGLRKFSLKNFYSTTLIVAFCCFVTFISRASGIPPHEIYSTLTRAHLPSIENTISPDTIPVRKPLTGNRIINRERDTTSKNQKDSSGIINDSLPANRSLTDNDTIPPVRTDTFSFRMSKDTLDAPIQYEAEDSAVVWAERKLIILYGKTKTTYNDVVLTAPMVELDQQSSTVTAYSERDSLDEVITRARFEQGENKFESDRIQFNFKSQKGITENTFTQQSEMFVFGETIKKVNESTVFIQGGRFTTCDLDDPHFAFRANKLKIINNKVAVSGPMHPEFENVPVPVWLPFGYYPLSRGRHSGFIAPQFTATESSGLGLENFGYYKVLNEYIDVMFRGSMYSYGGWRADLAPSYRKRYRYNGRMNFSVMNTQLNFRGDPDFLKNKSFQVNWDHSMDQRAKPGVNFSARVSAGSNSYNQFVQNDALRNFQNQLNSSVNYSKTTNKYNLTLAGNHSQNSRDTSMTLTIPTVGFMLNTLYPFQKDGVATGKWYEKISVGYNGNLNNSFSFHTKRVTVSKIIDTLAWGATHNFPINISLKPLGPFIVSPGVSYQQQWLMQQTFQTYDTATKQLTVTDNRKGLYVAHQAAFNLGFNTSLFGTFQFRNKKLVAIRHTIRPSFAFGYTPNMGKNYWRSYLDERGISRQYSLYQRAPGGGYGNQKFAGISFGIENSLQAKKRIGDSSETKKINLIDGLSLRSSYNFMADSFKLSLFNLYFSTSISDNIHITMGTSIDPYVIDSNGRRVNQYAMKNGRLGYITNGNISFSTTFQSKPRDPSKPPEIKPVRPNQVNDPSLLADQQNLEEYMRRNPNEFVDFNIPFDMGVDFSMTFDRVKRLDRPGFHLAVNSSLNFRNSFSLTPKWKISSNGILDIKTKTVQMLTMGINRELHCWQMSIGVTPVGLFRSFNITISPRSSILQDLKVNRTRTFSSY